MDWRDTGVGRVARKLIPDRIGNTSLEKGKRYIQTAIL
jgi:hypothetical protein